MDAEGLVWPCPTIGSNGEKEKHLSKSLRIYPDNSTGDNEVFKPGLWWNLVVLFFSHTNPTRPYWTYVSCASWWNSMHCAFSSGNKASFQRPHLPPTFQVMIVDAQHICCWMFYSAYVVLSEARVPQFQGINCASPALPTGENKMRQNESFLDKQTTMNGPCIICSICNFNCYWMLRNTLYIVSIRVACGYDSMLGCQITK